MKYIGSTSRTNKRGYDRNSTIFIFGDVDTMESAIICLNELVKEKEQKGIRVFNKTFNSFETNEEIT